MHIENPKKTQVAERKKGLPITEDWGFFTVQTEKETPRVKASSHESTEMRDGEVERIFVFLSFSRSLATQKEVSK